MGDRKTARRPEESRAIPFLLAPHDPIRETCATPAASMKADIVTLGGISCRAESVEFFPPWHIGGDSCTRHS